MSVALRLELMMSQDWITDRAFVPTVGDKYEVTFGEIEYRGKTGYWKATIRVNGSGTREWIDQETGQPLDPELAKYVVKGFRKVPEEP